MPNGLSCFSNFTNSRILIVVTSYRSLIFVCILLACTMFVFQQMRRRRIARPAGRVIATNTDTGISQLNPPYPCQVPPAFQRSYPHYPPPKPEQHQTLTQPPPYSPEAAEASEPHPPPTMRQHREVQREYVTLRSHMAHHLQLHLWTD